MAVVKMMCPKTNEVEFTGKATVDVKVSYVVDDNGMTQMEIISMGEIVPEEIKNISTSKGKIKFENLVQAMQSDISGNWYIPEKLVETEMADDENGGQMKKVIMTQEEYEVLTAPESIDDMNEDQAKAFAKKQQEDMATMQAQMQQMQEQMAQMMAQMQSQAQAAAQPTQSAQTAKPAQVAPAVATNIPSPAQQDQIDYAHEDTNFDGFNQKDEEINDPFVDQEAPF